MIASPTPLLLPRRPTCPSSVFQPTNQQNADPKSLKKTWEKIPDKITCWSPPWLCPPYSVSLTEPVGAVTGLGLWRRNQLIWGRHGSVARNTPWRKEVSLHIEKSATLSWETGGGRSLGRVLCYGWVGLTQDSRVKHWKVFRFLLDEVPLKKVSDLSEIRWSRVRISTGLSWC